MKQHIILVIVLLSFFNPNLSRSQGIQPSTTHPQYWTYDGELVLLLGGSKEDNLFQIDNLKEHLDLLKSVGGNYVRNTMSSRDKGNLWPFAQTDDGRYDLEKYNEEYWHRFEDFLEATSERDIIVQLEVWATFDFYRDNWDVNPFNPKNNVNYEYRRTKLTETVETHPIYAENNFFRSVPKQMAIAQLLEYQQKFVDKLLSHSLKYDHVLYCIDNETSVTSDWGEFWSGYIREQAALLDKTVHVTEMWDPWDLSHAFHRSTFNHPEIYSFVEISQNNHITGEEHWLNGLKQIERLKQIDALRPANNIKIYGNDGGRHKTTRDAIEAFTRNVLFGSASARFHRPTSGQGLNSIAQNVIKSMRMISDSTGFFNMEPTNQLLTLREPNEAFLRTKQNEEYILYFPKAGKVDLKLNQREANYQIRWLNLLSSEWMETEQVTAGKLLAIDTPSDDHWIAWIKRTAKH